MKVVVQKGSARSAAGTCTTIFTHQSVVGAPLASGATVEEIVGVLIAVAPTVGVARIVSAAPELALAVGYDIDSALERFDEGNRP